MFNSKLDQTPKFQFTVLHNEATASIFLLYKDNRNDPIVLNRKEIIIKSFPIYPPKLSSHSNPKKLRKEGKTPGD